MERLPETHITVKEAARRIGYSVRQTDRFIKQGELEAIHVNASLRNVSIASVDAFNTKHGRRPVDPLEPVNNRIQNQERIVGDILRQLVLLRETVEEQDRAVHKRISDVENRLRLLTAQLQQERAARQALEQALAALAPVVSGTEGDRNRSELLHQLLTRISRPSPRGQLPQERRGYPPETMRLAHFAVQHSIEPSTLRQHAEKTPGLATIYERLHATTKKREWWLLPEQQAPLLRYWQAQQKAWTRVLVALMS